MRYPVLGYAASKRCVMSMKLRQVQPGTLRRVMKYLGKREPSPPSIDHTQPMEDDRRRRIRGYDLLERPAAAHRAAATRHRRGRNRNGSGHRAMGRPDPMRMRPALVRPPDGQDRPLPPLRDDGGRQPDRLSGVGNGRTPRAFLPVFYSSSSASASGTCRQMSVARSSALVS